MSGIYGLRTVSIRDIFETRRWKASFPVPLYLSSLLQSMCVPSPEKTLIHTAVLTRSQTWISYLSLGEVSASSQLGKRQLDR